MPTGIYERVKENSGQFKKGQTPHNKGKKSDKPAWNKGLKTGKIPWNKGLKGVMPIPWNKGKKASPELVEKLRQAHLGKKLKPFTEEHKRKIGEANRGRKISEAQKKQIGDANRGRKHTAEAIQKIIDAGTGRRLSDKTRKLIGDSHRGEKSVSWLGGSNRKEYPMDFNMRLKEYIRSKYNFKCAICGGDDMDKNKKLAVHHIDYIKSNINEDNLIPLCARCHIKTNGNREYWKKYFKDNYADTDKINISGGTKSDTGTEVTGQSGVAEVDTRI